MWPIRPLATCPATIGGARKPRAPRPLAVRAPDHWKRRAQGALWFLGDESVSAHTEVHERRRM